MRTGKIRRRILKIKEYFAYYAACAAAAMYLYGIFANVFKNATHNFRTGESVKLLSLNPIKCFLAVFSPQGLGTAFFILIMYALVSGKWLHYITGVKIT